MRQTRQETKEDFIRKLKQSLMETIANQTTIPIRSLSESRDQTIREPGDNEVDYMLHGDEPSQILNEDNQVQRRDWALETEAFDVDDDEGIMSFLSESIDEMENDDEPIEQIETPLKTLKDPASPKTLE